MTPNPNPSPEVRALADIFDHFKHSKQGPGHCHDVPGIWDADNASDKAGKPCEWCAKWERAREVLISPQTLPAPGEVEVKPLTWSEPHASHTYPNWYARVYSIQFEARIDTGQPLKYGKFPLSINGTMVGKKFETVEEAKAHAQADYAIRVRDSLATVAAANDEGDWVNHERIRQEAYASGYRQGIDDAAMVADDLNFGTEIGEWLAMTKKDVSVRVCHECAAAIRLLSQGGGK